MEKMLDISSLPDKARAELMDFYEFLQSKYGCQEQGAHHENKYGARFKKFLEEPIPVRKAKAISRDALHERR